MAEPKTFVTPRRSASLIVINSCNEILFVKRNPKSGSFAGMHVFPGGISDSQQDSSLTVTAIRETFEETRLLLASPLHGVYPNKEELDEARENVHRGKQLFQAFLAKHDLIADVSSLMPFTQWTTPPSEARRYETQFFVALLNAAPSSETAADEQLEKNPTPDGGQEVIAARPIRPITASSQCAARMIMLLPPQFYLVSTLASLKAAQTHRNRGNA